MKGNKKKVFNDPVYGFINLHSDRLFEMIMHPYVQRLRRIKQLGLTELVYPGATHTRFHHGLGAMHLMQIALNSLRNKQLEISDEEFEATLIAILLHDVGHSPFSHALEYTLVPEHSHEYFSQQIIAELAATFGKPVQLAYDIFTDRYERHFFHQLVSGQLDIDRLDYLKRDCFYTGVSEGAIGADRIIKMLYVAGDNLVVEQKGIYSIENFLYARRLMYWQVYLHKTSISAERMLVALVNRARVLMNQGAEVFAGSSLRHLLGGAYRENGVIQPATLLKHYTELDDHDIWYAIKQWVNHEDVVLSNLSKWLMNRNLFRIRLTSKPATAAQIEQARKAVMDQMGVNEEEASFFYEQGEVSNAAYHDLNEPIRILTKSGQVEVLEQASDLPNFSAMTKIVKKYYLCWPKGVNLPN